MKKIYYALMVEDSCYKKFNKIKKSQGLTASALLVKLLGEKDKSKKVEKEG